ncbi:MAG: hypothetical protein ACLFTK_09575 [Anaerolineales bacterium]
MRHLIMLLALALALMPLVALAQDDPEEEADELAADFDIITTEDERYRLALPIGWAVVPSETTLALTNRGDIAEMLEDDDFEAAPEDLEAGDFVLTVFFFPEDFLRVLDIDAEALDEVVLGFTQVLRISDDDPAEEADMLQADNDFEVGRVVLPPNPETDEQNIVYGFPLTVDAEADQVLYTMAILSVLADQGLDALADLEDELLIVFSTLEYIGDWDDLAEGL